MKKVNFISSLAVHKQYELRYWFWATVIVWLLSLCSGLYLLFPCVSEFVTIQKEVNILRNKTQSYNELLGKKELLNTEYKLLSEHNRRIKNYMTQPKNPYRYIFTIFDVSGNGVKVECIKCHKKNIEITIVCPTSEHVTVFMKRLAAAEIFTDSTLISLHNDSLLNQLRAVIKGNVILLAK